MLSEARRQATMGERKKTDAKLVIISGPSGVGKSTICQRLLEKLDNLYLSISATTRAKADNEVDGREYWFISGDEFQRRIDRGLFLEWAEVFGNRYGTPKDKVDQALARGKTVILEIDVQGAQQVKAKYPDATMIFILPPTQRDLVERMNGRGRENDASAQKRLAEAGSEIAAAWQHYDHMVINDALDQAVAEVIDVIHSSGGDKQ